MAGTLLIVDMARTAAAASEVAELRRQMGGEDVYPRVEVVRGVKAGVKLLLSGVKPDGLVINGGIDFERAIVVAQLRATGGLEGCQHSMA